MLCVVVSNVLWSCYDMVTYVQGVILLRPGCRQSNVRTGQQGTGERTTGPSVNASLDLMLSCWRENICLLLINIAFLSHFFFCCANCVCVSLPHLPPLSSFFVSSSSLINQAPFCWRTAPWETLALSWLSLPHILKDLDHHTLGPPWIIALLCLTISFYLYFYLSEKY